MTIAEKLWRPDRPALLGGGRLAGPLGVALPTERHDGLTGPPRGAYYTWADKDGGSGGHGGKRTAKAKGGRKAAGTREITVIGNFKNPFRTLKDEIDAMKNSRWEPSVDDFAVVGGNKALVVDTYAQVLGAIITAGGERSVKRVNIITHADSDLIAFSGTIEPPEVMLNVDTGLSVDTLNNLTAGATFTITSNGKTFTLDDVRKRFATDAVLVIYACHVAVDSAFLQQIADTFQVKVRGFKSVIGYFPRTQDSPASINRQRVGVGARSSAKQETDFHKLDASNAIEKNPR